MSAGRTPAAGAGAAMPRSGADVDPCTLANAQLESQLRQLQARAFEIYEDAALRAEANPAVAASAYEQAEAQAAPLIAQARALNDERVRRLRRRARVWRRAALAAAIAGAAVLAWVLL